METYKITPAVDAVREFLEIAGDFTNPLEIVREAVSNSIDARASEITIEFSAKKELGTYVVQALIEDNGQGMSAEELQAFFDLGNSPKRDNPALIGEKGHGTKVYFNCSSIRVETSKDGVSLSAEMQQPYASLHNGTLPEATVTRTDTPGPRLGTKILIKGVEHETLEFGHFFPEQSKPIQQLFDEHLVRAPDFFCKQILRSGNLPKNPFIHYDAVFYIEGNRVKQGYNRMLRRQGYAAPAGGYTVQERYGIWLCKDFIPIDRRNEWIATKGSEFTKFHAFFNCQHLSLTANRGSVANTPAAVLADVESTIRSIYDDIIASDDWREMDWLESEAVAYQTAQKERNDFSWRQRRALRSNVAQLNGLTLVEPTRESGVYALLVQLSTIQPNLFPFSIVDYDTHSGIDVLAKMRDAAPVGSAELYYVELKYFLEATMNHSFDNMRYVVCWDIDIKHGGKISDLTGQERILYVVPADPNAGDYTGYFLRRDFKQEIEVFVLKDYLREKLAAEFRPRTAAG